MMKAYIVEEEQQLSAELSQQELSKLRFSFPNCCGIMAFTMIGLVNTHASTKDQASSLIRHSPLNTSQMNVVVMKMLGLFLNALFMGGFDLLTLLTIMLRAIYKTH
jgi:hypothetical protein